jgi:hypothetical protein
MGRDQVRTEIVMYVSRHNSPQDDADDALVEDFRAAVGALLALPRYADLDALDEGCTEAYRVMGPDRRTRVRTDLMVAYLDTTVGHRSEG